MHTLEQLLSGQLARTNRLKLTCGLTAFPPEIFNLADTLEILDLSGNQLTQLPDDFARLKNLRIAFFSDNLFTEFPAVLSQCAHLEMIAFKANKIAHIPENTWPPNLRWLILTNNYISEIPPSIGRCRKLQKLMLAGNKLKALPPEMALCQNLQLLRIAANNIPDLPAWLLTMPRLSWLAYAGNPGSYFIKTINILPKIHWNELSLEQQLGEGASGIISKATWHRSNPAEETKLVAVKVFKGDVTSDGLPTDEMDASMAAGRHQNLVPVLGKIIDHPAQKRGLVFELIPEGFKNLGGPPDFTTCTRDTFPEGTMFLERQILTIATGVAAVATHLHAHGLMHGDLYAHNILVDEEATPLLGDFGAATGYKLTDTAKAPLLERIEVRAFGCLVEDLLQHVAPVDRDTPAITALQELKEACMKEKIRDRPNFATIYEKVVALAGVTKVV